MLKITFLSEFDNLKTVCEKFALKNNGYVVPDYEQEYKQMVNRPLTDFDYFRIAKGILNKEKEYEQSQKKILFCLNNPYLIHEKSLNETQRIHPRFSNVFPQTDYTRFISKPENYLIEKYNIDAGKIIYSDKISIDFFKQHLV